MADEIISVNVSIPPDAHPGTLASENAALKGAMEITYKTWSGVNTAERKLDEIAKGTRPKPPGKTMDKTEKAFFQREIDEWMRKSSVYKSDLARDATPKIESALASLDKALSSARQQAQNLSNEINMELVPRTVDTTYDTEIREHLREAAGGRKATPIDVLRTAVDSGDRRVIAAVLGAPPFLLSIDQKTHDILKTTAIKKYCGEKQEALDALNADIDRVQRARDSFFERMTTSIRSWQSEVQQIIKEALA